MENNKLALHGLAGTGKSHTVTNLLGYHKDHTHYSTGDTAREIARCHGMTVDVYMVYARDNGIPIDKILDDSLCALNDNPTPHIIDSRLGFFFLKHAYKVYLFGEPRVLAKRRWKQLRKENYKEHKHLTIAETEKKMAERNKNDITKYRTLYGVTCNDFVHYDLIIDTTNLTVEQVTTIIDSNYSAWCKGEAPRRALYKRVADPEFI
ncbi:MAG TPA: (d)CMP kinase [Candidatus Paceibacterota bacterium]|jgi:cytidylate kinase|nr:(d)CMP kinase [Candidatus Paceibacterota bacterium]